MAILCRGHGSKPLLAPSPAVAESRFVIGERLGYHVRYANVSVSDFAALFECRQQESAARGTPQSSHLFHTLVEGDLEITVLEASGHDAYLAVRLHGPEVRLASDCRLALERAESIAAGLRRYHVVAVDQVGRMDSIHFNKEVDGYTRTALAALLASIEVVLPSAGQSRAGRWEAVEQDQNGWYVAEYRSEPTSYADSGDSRHFTKTKTRYLSLGFNGDHGFGRPRSAALPTGSVEAELDDSRRLLHRLRGTEAIQIWANAKSVGQSDTTIAVDYIASRRLTPEELRAFRTTSVDCQEFAAPLALAASNTHRELETALQQGVLGDVSTTQLIDELARLDQSGEVLDETQLYLNVKALAYLRPEACKQLEALLLTARAGGRLMCLVSCVCAALGHASAQDSLIHVIQRRREDWPALAVLIPSLAAVQAPGPDTAATILELTEASNDSIRSTAELAVGTMARSMQRQSHGSAALLIQWMQRKLATASSATATRHYLLVMGNADVGEALASIVPQLEYADPGIRSAAVWALRWIDGPTACRYLLSALADPDEEVRAEAAAAMAVREPDLASLPR
jgi:hypothetical protein